MKIQELAIIFIIIILPISLLLSEYTQFQIKTLNTQTIYDSKLTDATYDAIKAFQLNTSNETYSDLQTEKLRDLEASIVAFRNSIKSAFKLTAYSEDDLNNYIPALVYTLYDGFYIYSPYNNTNHRYIDADTGKTITKVDATNSDVKADGNGENLYGLKPFISYSCRYQRSGIDVVISYTLDNYITVRGMINDKYVDKSGYLIDNVNVSGETVKYNGVTIETEQLKEYVGNRLCNYAKVNGTKYYRMEDYIDKNDDGIYEDAIIYISNGSRYIQCTEDDTKYSYYENLILKNENAKQYYKEAKEFTDWFKSTELNKLTYADAYDEVIDVDGNISLENIWNRDAIDENGNSYRIENDTQIFDFNNSNIDFSENIENESSNFNQHRLAIIRHKIETNLAIAISNYNSYSNANNVFQMPELKEDEWENITHKISLISFLQGLPIGGKIYNGYSLVTNSESQEVVLEDNIYILGEDSDANKIYYRIGDNDTITVDAGGYGEVHSAGRLNLDFERITLNNENEQYYYYPLKSHDASYNSIVMQNNVTTYDDIYAYVNEQKNEGNEDLAKAFYTALGRERRSKYNSENVIGVGEP